MAEFCKQFNDRTNTPPTGQPAYAQNTPLSVELFAMSDRTFDFHVKSPSVSYLLRQACGQLGKDKKGPNHPNVETNPVGYVTPEVVYEIAKVKQRDPGIIQHLPLESIAKSIVGTARSIGIQVREEKLLEGK